MPMKYQKSVMNINIAFGIVPIGVAIPPIEAEYAIARRSKFE